jgi:putative phosphoesterase
MTVLGVLADTHIPDRVPELDWRVLQCFRQAGVAYILHAGDVSVPGVLRQLEEIAPVYAVGGNRDIFALHQLPMQRRITIEGISIGLSHGHGGFFRYTLDRLHRMVYGRLVGRYIRRVLFEFPESDVIVFGHLHVPCNFHIEGKLLFNPGSTSYPWPREAPASFGLLFLERGKEPEGEIIELKK